MLLTWGHLELRGREVSLTWGYLGLLGTVCWQPTQLFGRKFLERGATWNCMLATYRAFGREVSVTWGYLGLYYCMLSTWGYLELYVCNRHGFLDGSFFNLGLLGAVCC